MQRCDTISENNGKRSTPMNDSGQRNRSKRQNRLGLSRETDRRDKVVFGRYLVQMSGRIPTILTEFLRGFP
jgi:hypothetical protein